MTPDQPLDPAAERRTRLREATIRDIKRAARKHLLRYGPGELSLRAVARDVGVTPSALYRYFDSRGALVAALSADALDSAARAVAAAAPDASRPPRERLRAMFTAMRTWSHRHQSEFELLFANRDDQTRPDITRSREMQQLLAIPVEAALSGLVDGSLVVRDVPPPLGPRAQATVPEDIDPELLATAVLLCARCFGWLHLEHFGLVPWSTGDADAAFAAYLDGALGPE